MLILAVALIMIVIPHQGFSDTQTNPTILSDMSNYANTGEIKICQGSDDLDGDGICDSWEFGPSNPEPGTGFTGLHVLFTDPNTNTTYEYKLACNPQIAGDCPSPQHKDVYLELDWMAHHAPNAQTIPDVVHAFANAPVTNLDGTTGINLHVQNGTNATSGNINYHYNTVKITTTQIGTTYIKYVLLKQHFFGTTNEQAGSLDQCPNSSMPPGKTVDPSRTPASYNCLTAKRQVFHYGMFVNQQSSGTGPDPSSGWAEIPGNDFYVSLGSYDGGNGNTDKQEGTLMHELGHNLGLWHGGASPSTGNQDDFNCSPNYLSVMSYTYQFRTGPGNGVSDICRPLDFSNRGNLTVLNEASLTPSSLGPYPYPSNNPAPPAGTSPTQPPSCPISGNRIIWYSSPPGTSKSATTGDVVDWKNGVTTPNLNNFGVSGCNSAQITQLSSFDDWHHLNYTFTKSSNFFGGPSPINPNETETSPVCFPGQVSTTEPQNEEGKGNMTCTELAPTFMIGTASDGTQVTINNVINNWESGQPMSISLTFSDNHGNKIMHQNYAITVKQGDNILLTKSSGHTHTGDDVQTTSSLTSSDPVDITVTLNGVGLPNTDQSTWTGVKGEQVTFTHVVPEFGPTVSIILAAAILSIIVFAARTRIPKL